MDKLAGDLTRHDLYCQVAAKAQQAVEKSVKALQAALYDAKLVKTPVGSSHSVSQMASAIRKGAPYWSKALKGERDKITTILSDARWRTIKDLDAIVPQYPAPGSLPTRNTEYPFRTTSEPDAWQAPAEGGVFSKKEIARYRKCAREVQVAIEKVVVALELAYP